MAVLAQVMQGATACFTRSVDLGDIPLTATSWIDVAGGSAAHCADLHNPGCRPAAGDPQVQQAAVLRFGQLTTVHLKVLDPM